MSNYPEIRAGFKFLIQLCFSNPFLLVALFLFCSIYKNIGGVFAFLHSRYELLVFTRVIFIKVTHYNYTSIRVQLYCEKQNNVLHTFVNYELLGTREELINLMKNLDLKEDVLNG